MSFATRDRTKTGRTALHEFAPAGAAALDRLSGAISSPRAWVETVRQSCASALELPALITTSGVGPVVDEPAESLSLEALEQFAMQFSIDVSALDDAGRSTLCAATGESVVRARGHVIAMTWIADFVPRVRSVLDRLFRPSQWPVLPEHRVADATELAYEFVRVVYNLHTLDPATSELVRLRGARAHNCRLCKSVRSRAALLAGATVADFAAIDNYERSDLPPSQKAALGLVDAIIWTPARIDERVLQAVRTHFTEAQSVEIVLDVMRNAWNKTTVVAALDDAHVADGTEVYEYMDDGTVQYGLSVR